MPARSVAVACALIVGTLGACAGDDRPEDAQTTATSGAAEAGSQYLVMKGDEWTLTEAVNKQAAEPTEPSLDWYAEYDGPQAQVLLPDGQTLSSGDHVRLSGHVTGYQALASELEGQGFTMRDAKVGDRPARSGVSPDENKKPVLVVFELGEDYSAMALSYELNEEQVVAWAAELVPATEAEWVSSGGKVEG